MNKQGTEETGLQTYLSPHPTLTEKAPALSVVSVQLVSTSCEFANVDKWQMWNRHDSIGVISASDSLYYSVALGRGVRCWQGLAG